MTETLIFTNLADRLALTIEEQKLFLDLLSALDRGITVTPHFIQITVPVLDCTP
jgi:hypothetical protein